MVWLPDGEIIFEDIFTRERDGRTNRSKWIFVDHRRKLLLLLLLLLLTTVFILP